MRRVIVVVAAGLVLAAPADAASIDVSPRKFSPARGPLAIAAELRTPLRVGVQLATPRGEPVGWIRRPARRLRVDAEWNGRLGRVRVPDGRYVVRLVRLGRVLARARVEIDRQGPRLDNLRAGNGGPRFAGDDAQLTTITPNGDGYRDAAFVRFTLDEPATVTFEVARTTTVPVVVHSETHELDAGAHRLPWRPATQLNPRTYVTLFEAVDAAGNASRYGPRNARVGDFPRTPVVRLQGIDATLTRQVYDPGQLARLRIATDAPALTLRIFQSGPEREIVYADNQMAGVPVDAPPVRLDWRRNRDAPDGVDLRIGNWPSGLYYVELRADDGRVGYAPFVVRPAALGSTSRVAVVLPTNTWQAYNFYDVDGDGYGDTWYAGPPNYTVDLVRPYNNKGVMPRFYRYDLPVLHWLYWSGKQVEFLSDHDLDLTLSGDELARAYDLLIYEGHAEYVSERHFDAIARYRDLGGNLMFLSANNFFWRTARDGNVLRKTGLFRQIGKPESQLIGVQYRANDAGQRQANFVVGSAAAAPWLWDGTGLGDGGTFGQAVGGYGIEIDATTPQSPPGTLVLAEIPNLFGPGLTAQMTYYETPAGAKVFAAGALDFGGSALTAPVDRMLENLWLRLAAP